MRIKTQFFISLSVFGMALLAVAIAALLIYRQVERLDKQEELAFNIERGINELGYLSNDYLLYREDRQRARWEAKWTSLSSELLRLEPGTPEERLIVESIKNNHTRLKSVFDSTMLAFQDRERSIAVDTVLSRTRITWSRMAVQNQGLAFDAKRLSRVVSDRKERLKNARSLLFIVLSGIFSLYLIANYLLVQRRLLRSIAVLRTGTGIVGSGNLDYKVSVQLNDEIGELSGAFNQMTADLKNVTASKAELEREIAERKRTEDALRESEERLRLVLQASTMGSFEVDLKTGEGRWNAREFELLGLMPGEVLPGPETFFRYVHPEDVGALQAQWAEALQRGTLDAEFRIVRADGETRWLAGRGQFIYERKGSKETPEGRGPARLFMGVNFDITERKRAEEALKVSLHEKEVLLKEIHHRVKNNMQVISSLVSLQADSTKDETVREVLKDVTYRVRSMALVHEKLYQSEGLSRIDFAEYAKSLLNYLWRAHGNAGASVRLIFALEPVSLPIDIAVPCGLLLNELAGNALKHAFTGRETGEVTISLRSLDEGRVRLGVADNGVGLPPGLDWRGASSLGLRLVQMLSRQIGAEVEFLQEGGSEFAITIKVDRMEDEC